MKGFFNPDNWFWQGFGRVADYFLLSVCWMVCCIPLITIGSASIALYDAVAHCIREHESGLTRRFFSTFKKELGRGIFLTVLWVLISFMLNMGYQIITQMSQNNSAWTIFSLVYFITLILPLGMICWLVAIESRFENSFGALHKAALTFTFGYLPSTLAIVVILILTINLVINFPFFLIFLPAVAAHLQSIFIERIFRKYTEEIPA